jgi:hypothetical protein
MHFYYDSVMNKLISVKVKKSDLIYHGLGTNNTEHDHHHQVSGSETQGASYHQSSSTDGQQQI